MIENGSIEANRIQQELQNLKQFSKTLAKNGLIINGLVDIEGRGDYLSLFFQSLTLPVSPAATAFLVDYKGRSVIASQQEQALPLLPATTEFSETIILDELGLIVIEPVVAYGFVEGAIVLHYPASTFKNLFKTLTHRHSFYLLNQNNIVTYSDNPDLVSVGRPAPEISDEDWLQVRNEVSQSNLTVVIASSLKVAFKSLETVQLFQTIGLIVFLTMSIGLAMLAVSIVSRPLKRMAIGIAEIKNTNDLGRQLATGGPKEITDIASTFNRLSSWLQSTTVSRDYMDNILESITEGILTIDSQGSITTTNLAAKKIFGYADDQLIGKDISSILTLDGQNSYQSYLKERNSDRQAIATEALRADGTIFPIDLVFSPLAMENSKGNVCTIRDITGRKIIERRLEKQTQDLKRINGDLESFVFVASHDLKAPLRGIENLISWIKEDIEETMSDDTKHNMALVSNRVRRMANLLDGLQEYARVGSHKTKPVLVDTRKLVLDIFDLLAPPRGFSIDLPDPMPELITQSVSLEQVFRNLIGNAIKHHDQAEGHIVVSGKFDNAAYQFTITDDGPGINPDFHEKIFSMFQTLKPRDQVEGSGMGLAMVKKEVELHGGKVRVESSLEKRGSSFCFSWQSSQA